MSCNIINGISLVDDCENNVGGVSELYLIDSASVTATTVVESAWTVTNIAATEDFSTFQFRRNTASVSTEMATDLLIGSTVYTSTINIKFSKRTASKSRALNILGEGGRYLNGIVKTADGKYWYYENLVLTSGAETTGVAKTDGSQYDCNFIDDGASHRAYEVDSSIIANLIG